MGLCSSCDAPAVGFAAGGGVPIEEFCADHDPTLDPGYFDDPLNVGSWASSDDLATRLGLPLVEILHLRAASHPAIAGRVAISRPRYFDRPLVVEARKEYRHNRTMGLPRRAARMATIGHLVACGAEVSR